MSRECACYTCRLLTAAVDIVKELEKLEFTKANNSKIVRVINREQLDKLADAYEKLRSFLSPEW
jgi:nitrate reductase NapAB chaperone NapD